MKKIYVSIVMIFLINGCGPDKSSDYYGTVTVDIEDGTYYQCPSKVAFDACLEDNTNCSACTLVSECKVEDNTVTGINGKTCDHELHTLECNDGVGTVDSIWTDEAVVVNNMTYKCIEN